MNKRLFREKSVKRLTSPEQLDQVMVIASSADWMALAALGCLVIAGWLWGIYGVIHNTVSGVGLLSESDELIGVYAPSSGELVELMVTAGETVQQGQMLGRIERSDLRLQILLKREQLEEHEKQLQDYEQMNQSQLQSQLDYIDKNLKSIAEYVSTLEKHLEEKRRILAEYKELSEKGAMAKVKYEDQVFSINQIENELEGQRSELKRQQFNRVQAVNDSEKDFMQRTLKLRESILALKSDIKMLDSETLVMSPRSGRILMTMKSRGNRVQVGEVVMTLVRHDHEGMKAICFLSPNEGKKVTRGMRACISPSTVNPEDYGSIIGIVTDISEYPVSASHMHSVLQNKALVQYMANVSQGAPYKVTLKLMFDDSTYSGFEWTSSEGPPLKITPGTTCSTTITTSTEPPLSYVFKFLKKYILGTGQKEALIRKQIEQAS